MSKQVRGPDGRIYSFPDDATSAEILRFFEQIEGASRQQSRVRAQAAQALNRNRANLYGGASASVSARKRSLWERFTDTAEDWWSTAPWAQSGRWLAGRIGDNEFTDPRTGQRVIHENVGTLVRRREAERRDSYAQRVEADPWHQAEGGLVGKTLAGGATLLGGLTGAAADPTSWLGFGRTMIAKATAQGALAGGFDVVGQAADVDNRLQDEIDLRRTALAAAAGGGLSVLGDLAGYGIEAATRRLLRRPEANARVDLEVGDELNAPALTMREIEPTPPRTEGSPPGNRQGPDRDPLLGEPDEPAPKPTTLEQAHAPARYVDPASPEGQALHAENKLLDEDGKPLTFFHGTLTHGSWSGPLPKGRPFEEFDPNLRMSGAGGDDSSRAFFVSTSERTAKSYAGSRLSEDAQMEIYRLQGEIDPRLTVERIMEEIDPDKALPWSVADRIDRVFWARERWELDDASDYLRDYLRLHGKTDDEADAIVQRVKDAHLSFAEKRATLEKQMADIEANQDNWKIAPNGWVGQFHGVMKNPLEVDFHGGHYDGSRYNKLLDQMEAGGHDGLIIRNVQDGGGAPSDVYLFPDADQLRPARPRLQGMVAAAPPARGDLQARWDALDYNERFEVGLSLLKKYASALLARAGIAGTVREAGGVWEGTPEATVRIDLDDNVWGEDVLRRLARLFNQDSVLAISREPHPDYFARDIATVELGDLEPEALPRIIEALDAAGHGATVVDRRLVIADLREDVSRDIVDEIADIIDSVGDFPTISVNKTQSHVRLVSKTEEPHAGDPKQDVEPGDNGGASGRSESDRLLEDDLAADFEEALARIEAERQAAAGGSGGGEPPRGNGDLTTTGGPDGPRGDGDGDGLGGWDDIDWGTRKSPERVAAAIRHLEGLRKWIKPEAVKSFLRVLDEGITPDSEGVYLNERWVDWDKMGGNPDDVLGLVNAMADIFGDVYRKAGTATQGWEITSRIAKQLGFTLSDVIKTHADITGEGGLAARTGALRDAALASDKAFYDQLKATQAAMAKGDLTGVGALAESLQRTILMSAMDAGAASEIARALQYRQKLGKPKFPKNDLQAAVDEINSILNKGGDLDEAGLSKVFEELSKSYERGGSAGLRNTVKAMREMGFWDYVNYYATASLLSAPTTHIKNAFGTPIHALFQIGERYIAAGVGAARAALGRGSAERVTFDEAVAYSSALFQGWAEGLALGGKAFLKGAPVVELRSSVMTNEMAAQVPFAYSKERLAQWKSKPLSPKTWADALGVAVFEFQRTLGFRISVATDELYKALGRRMQVNALAYREAAYRAALAEPGDADAVFKNALKALQDEPTADAHIQARMWFDEMGLSPDGLYEAGSKAEEMALILRSIDHRQMAIDHSQLLTFQTSGSVVEKFDRALRAVPIVKGLWVNFIRTPVAILKAGLVTRNPLVGSIVAAGEATTAKGFAKHKRTFDALFAAAEKEEIALARGGAEADLVVARQVLGAAVLTSIWMFWASGNITGKQTEQERQNGVLDYSFRLPNGEWVQYSGMSPLGEMIGLVADAANGMQGVDIDDDGIDAVVGALAAAVRNNIVNKSFLKGVSDFMEMMTGGSYGAPDAESGGEQMVKALSEVVVPRMIPGGALFRRQAHDQDPVMRDARSFIEMVYSGLPGLSESLAARRDFLGRPLIREPGERGIFQAFNTSAPTEDPLERELGHLASLLGSDFRIGMPPRKLNGEDLTPHEYSRLVETQGQLLRIRGLNMEETLRELISDPEYQAAHPESRAFRVKRVIERFRTRANKAVRDPRSEFYMAEAARRTGALRLERETRQRGWSEGKALNKALDYGLQPDDPELEELREALFPTEP